MGYDLSSLKGKKKPQAIYFNISGWDYVTRLANQYGWKPKGTVYESFEAQNLVSGEITTIEAIPDWNGSYFSNDGQVVTTADAKAMKKALEKALPDEEKQVEKDNEYWIPKLKDFIKFLDNGAFRIL